MKHLTDHFPHTHATLREEVAKTEKRLRLLQQALQDFESVECTTTGEITPKGQKISFEVVCPQECPRHFQGRGFGESLTQCAHRAKESAGRTGPLYAFLNLPRGASVAISQHDFSNLKFQNHSDNGRVCWTIEDRKTVWLT